MPRTRKKKLLKKKSFQKLVIFPTGFLILNVFEEIIEYKSAAIDNPWLQTLLLMFILLLGISFVGLILIPTVENLVGEMHQSSNRKAGRLGELMLVFLIYAALYLLYFQVYIHGPESVLPAAMRNIPQ